MPYFVGEPSPKEGQHHNSIKDLWELKWKKKATLEIYPFMEGKLEDFTRVFNHFYKHNLTPPYNFEEYAKPFFPVAEDLIKRADEAEASGDLKSASALYLRAACVYRTARQPCPQSSLQNIAWARQKETYYKGAKYLDQPITEVLIPHVHGKPGTSEEGSVIPVSVRLPSSEPGRRFPTVMTIYGLDGYRTEHTGSSSNHISRGWASIGVEIPGTGDCPADPNDPTSPDRLWDSVLDWADQQDWIQRDKFVPWGVSCGGYYAMRIAHTHKERLTAVVAQGGGCHLMYDPEWLNVASHMEYPFDLTQVLALKFGYANVEDMKRDSMERFSLLVNGIMDKPSCRLLLVNGMLDELFPIEDSQLMLQHGSAKEARFFAGIKHMGEPHARPFITEWIDELFKSKM
ncbi:yellowish-green 1-like protein [Aureobasidium namibiae CBS 147.97]|uniref:Yellowish-green 1-like protein n=1 Tax=Aureobasidium namibiae CBS 147.97 TaxID=1043004 RepID=A0A074WGU4_9PEZI